MTITAVAPTEVGVEVGTTFVRSWGYDQTNVDYYRVVGLTAKGVKIQQWSHASVGDRVKPGEGPGLERVWPTVPQADLDACRTCRQYADDTWGPGVSASAVRHCTDHGSREQEYPIKTVRLQRYPGGSVYVNVDTTGGHASVWDGTPDYQTPAGAGH